MHYENTPMQHTAIFYGCKNDNFPLKLFDHFQIFAQNIDCGYTLEPPHVIRDDMTFSSKGVIWVWANFCLIDMPFKICSPDTV